MPSAKVVPSAVEVKNYIHGIVLSHIIEELDINYNVRYMLPIDTGINIFVIPIIILIPSLIS